MPLGKNVKYRMVHTAKGNVRLAFDSKGNVLEAKNMETGATHTPAEFRADREKAAKAKKKKS